MSAELHDVIAYLCEQYPARLRDDLSNSRVTKMVYLADWLSCLEADSQMTGIQWHFHHHGPFVHDVIDTVKSRDDLFCVSTSETIYGDMKQVIRLRQDAATPSLGDNEKRILDRVVEGTAERTYRDFLRLIYATYPVLSNEKHSNLNLLDSAREYKQQRRASHEEARAYEQRLMDDVAALLKSTNPTAMIRRAAQNEPVDFWIEQDESLVGVEAKFTESGRLSSAVLERFFERAASQGLDRALLVTNAEVIPEKVARLRSAIPQANVVRWVQGQPLDSVASALALSHA